MLYSHGYSTRIHHLPLMKTDHIPVAKLLKFHSEWKAPLCVEVNFARFAKNWKVTSESSFMAGSEWLLKCTNPCSAGCNAHYRSLILNVAPICGTSFWPPFMVYILVMFWVDAVWLYSFESHSYISPNWWISGNSGLITQTHFKL